MINKIQIILLLCSLLFGVQTLKSVEVKEHENRLTNTVPMKVDNWILPKKTKYKFELFDGRETLFLDGKAFVQNQQLSNGVIEVDFYGQTNRSFAGIIFRKQGGTMEEVYLRLHKSGQVDALQYSPTFNQELTWQLYRELQSRVALISEGWNKLRVDIKNKRAIIYINNERALIVSNLKTDHSDGGIGLFSLFGAKFSNFKFSKHASINVSKNEMKTTTESPIIKSWKLTNAFSYREKLMTLIELNSFEYRSVDTETSGLLPISKHVNKSSFGDFESNEESYVVAKTSFVSDRKQIKKFYFDFSDKAIVYFNGEPIFYGNNAFRSKGIQYMGHIDINSNMLYLNLKKGLNIIHIVVVEKANGWGLLAKLE